MSIRDSCYVTVDTVWTNTCPILHHLYYLVELYTDIPPARGWCTCNRHDTSDCGWLYPYNATSLAAVFIVFVRFGLFVFCLFGCSVYQLFNRLTFACLLLWQIVRLFACVFVCLFVCFHQQRTSEVLRFVDAKSYWFTKHKDNRKQKLFILLLPEVLTFWYDGCVIQLEPRKFRHEITRKLISCTLIDDQLPFRRGTDLCSNITASQTNNSTISQQIDSTACGNTPIVWMLHLMA